MKHYAIKIMSVLMMGMFLAGGSATALAYEAQAAPQNHEVKERRVKKRTVKKKKRTRKRRKAQRRRVRRGNDNRGCRPDNNGRGPRADRPNNGRGPRADRPNRDQDRPDVNDQPVDVTPERYRTSR